MELIWIVFFALILGLLALDLGVFHREAHEIKLREAVRWSILWASLGLSFSAVVYLMYEHQWMGAVLEDSIEPGSSPGWNAAVLYVTGYLVEESLSIDNIFVIALILASLKVPSQHQHRVLFWGIIGALVMRTLMIGAGVELVKRFSWIFYVFGGFLVLSGGKLLFGKDDDDADVDSWFLRLAKRTLPMASAGDHGGRFMVREGGKRRFTQLFLALIAVEFTDLIFAVDSVPAVLAISKTSFIIVTSNIFAIMGLRSLFFVLAGMMNKFRYLKTSLALLLLVIGAKLILHGHYEPPKWVTLVAVVGIVGAGVVFSLFADRREHRKASLESE